MTVRRGLLSAANGVEKRDTVTDQNLWIGAGTRSAVSLVMRSILLSTVAAASLVACIQPKDDPHPVARALPTAEQVKVKLPDGEPRTVGEIAPWYVATRDVTRSLNGGTAWVLILVHTIVQFPPTSAQGDTYTWGPWSDALDPAEYKLEVTELSNGSYDWALSGKSKTEPGASFEVVIAGNAVPSEPEGRGAGEFTIDFDAGARVNPIDSNGERGVVSINYDLAARHLDLAVSTVEDRGGVEVPVDYDYSYDEAADRSGNMVFAVHADTEDEGSAAEDVTLRSRWQADGAGRSDIQARNGDLGVDFATASQCWNRSFRTVFSEFVFGGQTASEGAEADCAYATASMPR
jgi:hypothetical protein